jgi:hypothetical protein
MMSHIVTREDVVNAVLSNRDQKNKPNTIKKIILHSIIGGLGMSRFLLFVYLLIY